MPKSQNIPKNIPTIFSCDLCNYNSIIKKDFARHNLTRKHIMKQNDTINPQKSPKKC